MIEGQTWDLFPTPRSHCTPTRKAFQALKMYDREVAKSDALLIRIETAYRDGDVESLLWMTSLALTQMLGEAING